MFIMGYARYMRPLHNLVKVTGAGFLVGIRTKKAL
jgi:hypothetical protein